MIPYTILKIDSLDKYINLKKLLFHVDYEGRNILHHCVITGVLGELHILDELKKYKNYRQLYVQRDKHGLTALDYASMLKKDVEFKELFIITVEEKLVAFNKDVNTPEKFNEDFYLTQMKNHLQAVGGGPQGRVCCISALS